MERTTNYSGMGSESIRALLAGLQHPCSIISGPYCFRSAGMVNDDGIYTSGTGLYVEYIAGRRAAVTGPGTVACCLEYTEFSITEDIKQ